MLEQYEKCFKACDIRGITETQLDEKFMYILGKGMGKYFAQENGKEMKMLIWCDVRESNTKYLPHFLKGLQEEGIHHIAFAKFWNEDETKYPFGIASTEITYYLGQHDFDIGIAVTASHNPKEYLWMKFFDKEVNLLPSELLKHCFEEAYFEGEYDKVLPEMIDTTYEQSLIQEKKVRFFDFLKEKWNQISKKYKIVVDFSTGAWITVEKEFLTMMQAKHELVFINDYADGSFSAHESDTSDRKNYEQLAQKVKDENADFGIMFDGDVDRIGFVTWDGEVINCDIVTAIIANQVLQTSEVKGDIVFDSMSSKIIEDTAEKYGVKGIRYKTGRFFINEKLAEVQGVLGGEASGHYMFHETGGFEMPLLALYYVLCELQNYSTFQAMIQQYMVYFKTPIMSYKTEKKAEILEKVKEEFWMYHQEYLDGVSVFADDFWCNVRPSNNEPKMRYVVEAETEAKKDEISQKIERIIQG